MNIGAQISRRRRTRGWSEMDFAATLDLDVPQLRHLEDGKDRFTAKQLFLICSRLEMKPADLYENCMSSKGPAGGL